ncbi:MAG TPA: hypothetical protein VIJ11_03280, partial [Galbitalea sp.]
GPTPAVPLTQKEQQRNDLPGALARWRARDGDERARVRTDQSFTVPKVEIAEQNYDLSLNRYKEVVHDKVEHRAPLDIIADLEGLEAEIERGLADLKVRLG